MKYKICFEGSLLRFIMLSLFMIPLSLYAQSYQVKGVVYDTANEPLIGANVSVKGTTNGTITDIDGNFTLEVAPKSTLVISYMGYITQSITANSQKTIQVTLKEDTQMLDETVVIGYGSMKKSDMTGAIASVDVEALASRATTNPAEALQGKVAGVSVLKSGGNAGAGIKVKIRGVKSMGANDPLYIIDGFPGDISTVNPSDISSMEVLKDGAAAAIYGSVAASGVIIITTKNGKKGDMKVDFGTYFTITNAAKKQEMLDAKGFLQVQQQMYSNAMKDWNTKEDTYYTYPKYIQFDKDGKLINPTGADTNWQDEMLRSGFTQNYNVSVRGGSENAQYSISYNRSNEDGIFLGNSYKQDNARAKLSMSKYIFDFDANVSFKATNNMQPVYSLKEMYLMSPLVPVYDSTTKSGFGSSDIGGLGLADSRNVMADHSSVNDKIKNYNTTGNIAVTMNFTKWLKLKTSYSYTGIYSSEKYHTDAYEQNSKQKTQFPGNSEENQYFQEQVFDNVLTFDKKFGKNSITALVGNSISMTDKNWSTVGVDGKKLVDGVYIPGGFSDPHSPIINAGIGGSFNGEGSYYQYRRSSFFGRVNYSYAGKYLFQGSLRRDGSSKVGLNNRWANFPSAAIGWRASEEDFFPKNAIVSNLKIRASWGRLGNEETLGYYDYNPLISISNKQWMSYVQGGNPWAGAMSLYLSNNDLAWEITETSNVGVDFGLFDNKLSGSVNGYYNTTTDLLIEKIIAPSAGSYNSTVNVGKMRNMGLEFEINYADSYEGFDYNVGFNLTTTSNKMLKADPTQNLYGEGLKYGTEHFPTQTVAGRPVASFFLYRTDGIFQSDAEAASYKNANGDRLQKDAFAGDIRFKDLNGDGQIDENDKEYCGSGIPKVEANISFSGSFKGFDLSLLIGSGWGNKLYNGNRYFYEGMNSGSNFLASTLHAWSPENRNTDIPRPVMDDFNGNSRESDRFLENGDFIRLRQLQIGYSLPSLLLKKIYLEKCRLYVSGENLLTWTNYSGIDPEFSRKEIVNTGVDKFIYPFTRSFIVGLQVTF